MKKARAYPTIADRRMVKKTEPGAIHKVNPAGTKLLRAFRAKMWCGRPKGPFG